MQFLEVFDGLRSESRLKKVFEKSSVTDITSSNKHNRMDVYIDSDIFIKTEDRKQMEKLLLDQFFMSEGKDVYLHIRCIKENADMPDIWSRYGVYVDDEFSCESGLLESIYKNANITVGKDKINIELDDNFINRQTEKKISETITTFLNDYFGLKAALSFSYREHEEEDFEEEQKEYLEHMESYILEVENSKIAAAEDKPADDASNTGSDSGTSNTAKSSGSKEEAKDKQKGGYSSFGRSKFVKKKLVVDPDVVYGTTVEGDVIDISEIIDNMGDVVIKGMVLKVYDLVTTKTGKFIFKFSMTDFTDSILCKFFIRDEEDKNNVINTIKEGSFFLIKGSAETDMFEPGHETTIQKVRGIKPIKDFRVKRRDEAEVKRIELHAHTQMSDMDGVIPANVLVKRALEWGHRGIAITDHGVVQSFPIANHAIDFKKIKDPEALERAKKFKIIYGCEGYIVDDEPDVITNDKGHVFKKGEDGKYSIEDLRKMPSYHIILLCKNDTGRINLYKLVSEAHLKYFGRWPRIPKSVLKENREGIIVGSACEAGELYRAIVHEKPMEEVRRIADFYDYYEIQQIGNNNYQIDDEKFPEIQNENDLRRVNKRIVDLADADGKMCVATCDVHFLDPEDEV